jgi:hypothetical protein
MPRSRTDKCNNSWENLYGTTAIGNLPQYKRYECVSDVVDLDAVRSEAPWVRINDFHYYHFKCPYGDYSTVSGVISGTLNWAQTTISGNRALYFVEEPDRAAHNATAGMMIKYSRGSAHGWMCVDPNCPYYRGIASGTVSGTRYFYI